MRGRSMRLARGARLTRAAAQVGDYADTLMLPNLGTEAVIRWLSGPADIVGTGSAVLHCHILPVRALARAGSVPVGTTPQSGGALTRWAGLRLAWPPCRQVVEHPARA